MSERQSQKLILLFPNQTRMTKKPSQNELECIERGLPLAILDIEDSIEMIEMAEAFGLTF